MARAKSTPAVKEVKSVTKEQLNTLKEIKIALDCAGDDIRDLGEDGEEDQRAIGFILGKLYNSLMEAYHKTDNLIDELDTDDEDVEEMEF